MRTFNYRRRRVILKRLQGMDALYHERMQHKEMSEFTFSMYTV